MRQHLLALIVNKELSAWLFTKQLHTPIESNGLAPE